MKTLLLAAATVVITPTMTQEKRIKVMSPYFDPSPGKFAELSRAAIRNFNNKKDPLKVRGYVVVRPPKGQCFIITRHHSLPDDRICEEEKVWFNGYMLDDNGDFSWRIKTSASDPGYVYTWKTKYRIAQVIKAEKRPWTVNTKELIYDCNTYTADDPRVVVTILKDRPWVFRMPETHVYKKPPLKFAPDDVYADTRPQKEEKEEGIGELGVDKDPRKEALENMHLKEHVTKYWMMREEGAYVVKASNFSTSDSPAGQNGECLYQFEGAYHDKKSGWIECHFSDDHDVVYVPMTCMSDLKPKKQKKKKS